MWGMRGKKLGGSIPKGWKWPWTTPGGGGGGPLPSTIVQNGGRTFQEVPGGGGSSRLFHGSAAFGASDGSFRVGPVVVPSRNLLSYGQPTLESHAEFFAGPLEIIPGVFREELRVRRTALCNMVSDLTAKTSLRGSQLSHLIFIPASRKKYMTENIPYPFRQNSQFLYLSGSFDPEAFIVLCATPTEQMHAIFLADPDPMSELWDGPRTSVKAAVDHYGFDRAFVISEFDGFLREFARLTNKKVKIWCEETDIVDKIFHPNYGFESKNTESPKAILDMMRSIKSPSEISLMRQSCKIASEAFQQTIKYCAEQCSKGESISEHQIWAKIDYECRIHGAERLAYPPVVASGSRANVIHYVFNSNKCNPKDLVLVDAGCEFFGYCSDITRTWPVSGKFNDDKQKSLYQMMLQVQTELIKEVGPGITLDQLFRIMSTHLVKGLESLGIIKQGLSSSTSANSDIALRFCPHHVGHHLGMDVHDTPTVERSEPLQPSMVITIEPGVYIRNVPSQKDLLTKVGKEFLGMAVRIEDDVLVTTDGQTVLSQSCPKSIEDIERWGVVSSRN